MGTDGEEVNRGRYFACRTTAFRKHCYRRIAVGVTGINFGRSVVVLVKELDEYMLLFG